MSALPDRETPLDYQMARHLAGSPDAECRRGLAAREDVAAEILYFLAGDAEASVRAVVAANMACPAKGNLLLADDAEVTVRAALASKMQQCEKSRGGSINGQAVDRLTRDSVTRVRALIAQALKDFASADPAVINRLARDSEIIVAAPILESSPVLTNADLLAIIGGNPVQGALSAISRRAYVDQVVTSAIVESNDSAAITHLLKNSNAHLQESVLDRLIEQSVHQTDWQEPLVYRRDLTPRSALRLAELVAVHLLDRLLARKDLPEATIEAVGRLVGDRLRQEGALPEPVSRAETVEAVYGPRLEKARDALGRGQLDEIPLLVMVLTDQTEDLVASLAVLSQSPVTVTLDILDSCSPRAICALCWAAGLPASFAFELQTRRAGIPLDKTLRPTAEGGYSLPDADMRWQLEMFGGEEPV